MYEAGQAAPWPPEGPEAPRGPWGPGGWVGGGDPTLPLGSRHEDLSVVTKHESAGTRSFHAPSREIRVDGNNPQGSSNCH